jgi:signal peptidase I
MRVVALGGERIKAAGGRVRVNDEPIPEGYLNGAPTPDFDEVLVPRDAVFVLGDNRGNAQDSRYYGAVPTRNIEGRVVAVDGPSVLILLAVTATLGMVFLAVLLWPRLARRD